ncbi:hypothetical protein Cgig2_028381 [Carnegiea gigantea]|uniref:Protein DEFECTIVE IN MERISTEM SILENCING 3 n=1 Tax=Carnegiea gigantea TaxID=171969 RepID=A0A9Q1QBV6_9CARY|nr:hypothetical protein Cgig2_028381 [Carnegiea gigantea]
MYPTNSPASSLLIRVPINSRALVVQDITAIHHVDPNTTFVNTANEVPNGAPAYANSLMSSSQKLQDEVEKSGSKIKWHEDNLKFLKAQKNQLDDAILDLQGILGKHISSSVPKTEDDDTSHSQGEEETVEQILKHENSAAGIYFKLQRDHGSQLSNLTLSQDVLGVVATLGKVDDDDLSRLFAEYLGLGTMLTIVCKTYEGIKALEIHDGEGLVNKGSGIQGLGASIGRVLQGRFLVICLDTLRHDLKTLHCQWSLPYAGDVIVDDPQRRLDIPKPRLPSGDVPAGFLGFAVNMIHVERPHLFCLTSSGCGLRETLFYNLFSRLQVYRTRAEMLLALPCISDGAVSLDGGMIRAPGVFSLGSREDVDVWFPKCSKRSVLAENCYELEKRLKEKKWERERILDDIRREQALLDQEKYNFSLRKQEFLKFVADSSSYLYQVGLLYHMLLLERI